MVTRNDSVRKDIIARPSSAVWMRGSFLRKLSAILFAVAGFIALFTLALVLWSGGLGSALFIALFYAVPTVILIPLAAVVGLLGWWMGEMRFDQATKSMVAGAVLCLSAEAMLSTKVVPADIFSFAVVVLLPAVMAVIPILFSKSALGIRATWQSITRTEKRRILREA